MIRAAVLLAMLACLGPARAADRTEESEDAAARFAEANDTPELRRFDALLGIFGEAMAEATDREQLLRHGPIRSFPGAEAELRAHCIR